MSKTDYGLPSLFLTVDEAADHLRCSRSHVYKLASQGLLRLLKFGGASRVARGDLERLAAAPAEGKGKASPKSEPAKG